MQTKTETSDTNFRQFILRINLFIGSTHLESPMNNIPTFVLIGSKWFDAAFVRRSKVLEIHVMLQLKLRPTEAVCKHHKNTRKHSSWNSEPKLQWVHILYIITKINFYSLSSWFVTNTFNDKTSWSILTTNHAKQHDSLSCGVFCLKVMW